MLVRITSLEHEEGELSTLTALSSCEAVLGEGACQAEATEEPLFLAEMSWQEQWLLVRLRRAGDETTWLVERRLEFSENDQPKQRWVAAGLLIAALTAAEHHKLSLEKPEVPAEPELEPEPPAPVLAETVLAVPPLAVRPSPFRLDGGVRLGPGPGEPSLRLGGLLRFSWFPRTWGLTLATNTELSVATPAEILWVSGAAGAGVRLTQPEASWDLRLLGEGVLQWVQVGARQGPAREQSQLTRGGARLALDSSWATGGPLHPWLNLEASYLLPSWDLQVASRPVLAEESFQVSINLGAQLRF